MDWLPPDPAALGIAMMMNAAKRASDPNGNHDRNGDESIEIGHGSTWARIYGRGLLVVIIQIVATALILWRFDRQDAESKRLIELRYEQSNTDIAKRQNDLLQQLIRVQELQIKILSESEAQTYLQSITEPEKRALNLREPRTITERRRGYGP